MKLTAHFYLGVICCALFVGEAWIIREQLNSEADIKRNANGDIDPVPQPPDGCVGAECKCPPGMLGIQPFCQPAEPMSVPQPPDGCVGAECKCPPGMLGIQPFCQPAEPMSACEKSSCPTDIAECTEDENFVVLQVNCCNYTICEAKDPWFIEIKFPSEALIFFKN